MHAIETCLADPQNHRYKLVRGIPQLQQAIKDKLQAQRDYFGAHTYERVDKPRGEVFHTNWTGRGGETSASTYSA